MPCKISWYTLSFPICNNYSICNYLLMYSLSFPLYYKLCEDKDHFPTTCFPLLSTVMYFFTNFSYIDIINTLTITQILTVTHDFTTKYVGFFFFTKKLNGRLTGLLILIQIYQATSAAREIN